MRRPMPSHAGLGMLTRTSLRPKSFKPLTPLGFPFGTIGAETEVDALTGYVVQLGKGFNVPVPTYDAMYQKLKARTA